MNRTIRTVIAEDEQHSRERLKDMLEGFPELSVVAEAADGLAAVKLIDEKRPDLVFLDIQMPEATGFDVLEKIEHQPHVIFITAYDQYAIKAFEENAVDYILKPFSIERIRKAVERILVLVRERPIDPMLIENLKKALEGSEYIRRFAAKLGDEILIIPEEEVYYIQAENKCVMLYTEQKKYFLETTLKELEQTLDPAVFVRIHKSTIVSLDKIRKIKKWFHSEVMVQLDDGNKTKLKVSRGYQHQLKEILKY
jgi:two-component system, LytTR family, response regulator LytT